MERNVETEGTLISMPVSICFIHEVLVSLMSRTVYGFSLQRHGGTLRLRTRLTKLTCTVYVIVGDWCKCADIMESIQAMPTLKNVSLRVVGVYLRINDPYNNAVPPPRGPDQIDLPEINVSATEPKVVDVMDAVAGLIMPQGFHFEFQDNGPVLNSVTFSRKVGDTFDYTLNAKNLIDQTGITFAWQYYVFKKNVKDDTKDERVPVLNRATYRSASSPTIRDNYRVIWRLIPIDKPPDIGAKAEFVGG